MFDQDTFLTQLYVICDDFCKTRPPEPVCPGPAPALSRSETLTLSLAGQMNRFASERDFYRFATRRLRHLFPTLPDRSQFLRLQCRYQNHAAAFALHLAQGLARGETPGYEVLDRVGVATRWCSRRGVGHLPDCTNKGHCSRLGFFHGFSLLTCVSSEGYLTGWGIAQASAKDQLLAQTFFEARQTADTRLPSAGSVLGGGYYLLDKGFSGPKRHKQWRDDLYVHPICAPQTGHGLPWPKAWRIWLASKRQIIETVHHKLLTFFRLERERPHDLSGFSARLSAKMALHNFCFWLNKEHGREGLAFADMTAW